MKRGLRGVVAVAAGLALAPAAHAARPAQAGPEYALLLAAVTGGFHASTPIYSCPGIDFTPLADALGGPGAVEKLGLELVEQTLGTEKKPWPRNHRTFTYQGRSWTPDFVKGRTLYLVAVDQPLNVGEIHDLRAVARSRGGELVVVTRRSAAVGPELTKAVTRWWPSSGGRVRILRCV